MWRCARREIRRRGASGASVVHALDKDLPVYGVKTMDQQLAEATSRARFSTVLLSAFAAVALLLAGIGLYGVVAFSVAARTREIGIRMALGARREEVMRLVMGDGLILCGVGVRLDFRWRWPPPVC